MADSSKTEQPTGKKLNESKEKGQLPKSQEISMVMQMIVFATVMFFLSKQMFGFMARSFYSSFDSIANFKGFTADTAMKYMTVGIFDILAATAPLFIALVITGLLVGGLQTGFTFAGKAMKVDFSKMNPIKGFGKIFSPQSWIELTKAIMKTWVIF